MLSYKLASVKVVELSSYQIETSSKLNLHAAVFLNLSNDHLKRHGGVGGYFASKSKLFYSGKPKFSIIGVDEKEGQFLAHHLGTNSDFETSVIQISNNGPINSSKWSVFISGDFLIEVWRGQEIFKCPIKQKLQIAGRHNLQNICAAYATCRTLGIRGEDIFKNISTFMGLPHRMELVRCIKGVSFVNDSKATNFVSASNALKSFENIRWIAGGQKKDGDILDFSQYYNRINKAYLFGSSAQFLSNLLGSIPFSIFNNLEGAVNCASNEAESGDTVLLAPGCASFDQFENFEERGQAFCIIVDKIEKEQKKGR